MKRYDYVGFGLIIWFTCVLNTLAFSSLQPLHIRNHRIEPRRVRPLEARYAEIPLDHFSKGSRTFSNRYYVNDTFYKPGGPVFRKLQRAVWDLNCAYPDQVLDVGETSAEPYRTLSPDSPEMDYVSRFGGILIIWEHRYYGTSAPNKTSGFSNAADNQKYFKYLTIEQALEDVVYFARNFSLPTRSSLDLSSDAVPWVFLGGSYAGSRSAWLRQRNPEVIFASLSSSAPVQLQVDFWQFFVAIERAMTDSGLGGCLQDLHAFATWATEVYEQRDVSLIETFLYNVTYSTYRGNYATTANTTSAWRIRADLLYSVFLAPLKYFQSTGIDGNLATFCKLLQTPTFTGEKVSSALLKNGIVEYFGLDFSVAVYAKLVAPLFEASYLSGSSRPAMTDIIPSRIQKRASAAERSRYSWWHQVCAEFGGFTNGNPARSTNLIPGFIDTDYHITKCVRTFGSAMSSGPQVNVINSKYNGWNMSPSNTFFVNGDYDPWRALSIASNVTSIPGRRMTATIPANGEVLANGVVFGYIIDEGLHCSDLSINTTTIADLDNDSVDDSAGEPSSDEVPVSSEPMLEGAQEAHELFAEALSTWLPEFTAFTSSVVTLLPTTTSNAAVPRITARRGTLITVLVIVYLICVDN